MLCPLGWGAVRVGDVVVVDGFFDFGGGVVFFVVVVGLGVVVDGGGGAVVVVGVGVQDSVVDTTVPVTGSGSEDTGVPGGTLTVNDCFCPVRSVTVTTHVSAEAGAEANRPTSIATAPALVASTARRNGRRRGRHGPPDPDLSVVCARSNNLLPLAVGLVLHLGCGVARSGGLDVRNRLNERQAGNLRQSTYTRVTRTAI